MKPYRRMAACTALLLALLLGGCWGSSKDSDNPPPPPPPTAPTGNLQSTITGATLHDNGTLVVTFTLRDENGDPLDPAAMLASNGNNRLRFYLARIKADGNYANYIPSSDDNTLPSYDASKPASSQFATVGKGLYTYTFRTDLDDPSKTLGGISADDAGAGAMTHTVAIQAAREVLTSTGKVFQQASNPYYNFLPGGGAVTATREVAPVSNCNECHGLLEAHGSRREVALCILCHYPGIRYNGQPVDMMTMVHKIHMGSKLPSRLGTARPSTVAGGNYTIGSASFTNIGYPFWSADSLVTKTPADCDKCHRAGKDLAGNAYGKDVAKHAQAPTYNKCFPCHDTLSFNGVKSITVYDNVTPRVVTNDNVKMHDNMARSAENPTGVIDVTGAQADNTLKCSGCHDVAAVRDNAAAVYNYGSVRASHTIFEQSSLFPGLHYEILAVDNALPGRKPVVTFRITSDNGSVVSPGASTSSFTLKVGIMPAGVPDYANRRMNAYGQPLTKSASAATAVGDGSYRIAMDNALDNTATGVGVVGLEGRVTYTLPPSVRRGTTSSARVGGESVQYFFDVATGAKVTDPAKVRRTSVDSSLCTKCHGRLAFHGGSRVNVGQCIICHNPNAIEDNVDTFNFKDMIHYAHTGEEMDDANHYKEAFDNRFMYMRYPQDRRNCLACHVSTAATAFPLPAGVLGTTRNPGADNVSDSDNLRTGPMTASCVSCHTDVAFSLPHAANQTTGTTELCLQCHTSGLLFGPDYAHQPVQ